MECSDGIGGRSAFGIHETSVLIVGTLHGTDGVGSFHHRAVFVFLMAERGRQVVPDGQSFADLVAIVGTQGEAVVSVSGDDAVLLVISRAEVVAHLFRPAADAELIVAYGSHTEDFGGIGHLEAAVVELESFAGRKVHHRFSFRPLLGGNDDYTVGTARTVHGGCRSVFQHLHRLDVVCAQERDVIHKHSVHHIKGVAVIRCTDTADTHFGRASGSTVG